MRLLTPILFLCVAAAAQSLPKIGDVLDSAGSLRPVFGIAGSFLVGAQEATDVISAACSVRICLAKTDARILSATGEVEAPPGPAVFALDGDAAIVYFPAAGFFARWHDDTLDPLDWQIDGEVLAIRVTSGTVEIAVRRDDSVWIVRPDGEIIDALSSPAGPALLLATGRIFTSGDALVLRRRDASEVRIDLTNVETLSALGENYVAIRAGGTMYALRIDHDREQLFLLPGSPE